MSSRSRNCHKLLVPQCDHTQAGGNTKMSDYCWKTWTTRSVGSFPKNAVKGGRDSDGSDIYIGRATHGGDKIPAKVVPNRNTCYVAFGGQEHVKQNCEVLCQKQFEWVTGCRGSVPPNAVVGGNTASGETLYIGRVWHNNAQTVGKVHPSHQCCYISYGGNELKFDKYEVLVSQ